MLVPLYYKYTNQWTYIFYLSQAFCLFGLIIFIFCSKPSPRELVAKSKFNEAWNVLGAIAKWNKMPPYEGKFKNEDQLAQSLIMFSPGSSD